MSAQFTQIRLPISAETEAAILSVYGGCDADPAMVGLQSDTGQGNRQFWPLRTVLARTVELCPTLSEMKDPLDRVMLLAAMVERQLLPEHEFLLCRDNVSEQYGQIIEDGPMASPVAVIAAIPVQRVSHEYEQIEPRITAAFEHVQHIEPILPHAA